MIEFQGVKANPNTSDAAIPLVYGYQRVIGPRMFFSAGKSSDTIVLAVALSVGNIEGITQIIIDDQPIILDLEGGVGLSFDGIR